MGKKPKFCGLTALQAQALESLTAVSVSGQRITVSKPASELVAQLGPSTYAALKSLHAKGFVDRKMCPYTRMQQHLITKAGLQHLQLIGEVERALAEEFGGQGRPSQESALGLQHREKFTQSAPIKQMQPDEVACV